MAAVDRTRQTLVTLKKELTKLAGELAPSIREPAFISWWTRVQLVLPRALGQQHPITQRVLAVQWEKPMMIGGRAFPFGHLSQAAAREVIGLLDAAVHELDWLSAESGAFDAAGVDPELWEFVAVDVQAAHWGKAVSQTALFTEDRVRRWTGQPTEMVGVDLMTAVLGPSGTFRLGDTEEERKGWHLLAMGLVKAVRNAAGHRLQNRPDHRRYALGALGAASLLLTQLRFQHGDRLVDRSPAHPDATRHGQTPIPDSPG